MSDAAQMELTGHEIFNNPLKVTPDYEYWPTPELYRMDPNARSLGDSTLVWRIQDTTPNILYRLADWLHMLIWDIHIPKEKLSSESSSPWGFDDSPDAEVIITGYSNKQYGAVAVGRHGNFLQWGFSAPPSQMTQAGKNLFINCINYIKNFDGKKPLIQRISPSRHLPMVLKGLGFFPENIVNKYEKDIPKIINHYLDNYELIYLKDNKNSYTGVFYIDEELKSLGIVTNRQAEILQQVIDHLDKPETAKTAGLLLERYTFESFNTKSQWLNWYKKNEDRFYFSDIGGYKFRIIPDGYK